MLLTVVGVTLYVALPNELFMFSAPTEERLPETSLIFLEETFPNAIVLDIDIELTGFEVYLSNGVSVEFGFSGQARYVDND